MKTPDDALVRTFRNVPRTVRDPSMIAVYHLVHLMTEMLSDAREELITGRRVDIDLQMWAIEGMVRDVGWMLDRSMFPCCFPRTLPD